MPQQPNPSVENSFVEGFKTEFTGLNFPENACTEASNVVFTLIGDVQRRLGIDFETNFTTNIAQRSNNAVSSYIWTNVGGDGQTKIYVLQVGSTLYFYQLTNATTSSPLSTTLLASEVSLTPFLASGSTANPSVTECQYADGNGFLFVFHPNCDPFYCQFLGGSITASIVNIQIRDTYGIVEPGVADSTRPSILTVDHNYNLYNQGWASGSNWSTTSYTTETINTGTSIWTVPTGLSPAPTGGDTFTLTGSYSGYFYQFSLSGTVTNYSGGTLTLNANSIWYQGPSNPSGIWSNNAPVTIKATNTGYMTTWNSQLGSYPSNSDVWWQFKNSSDTFAPSTTINQVTANAGASPKGYYILSAFNQTRNAVSGLNLPIVNTTIRPRTGCWFQGRVFYAGVDAAASAPPEFPYYTWTENIYFSQIVEGTRTDQFAKCYQVNDPTSETLFDLLPSDGGVITIQGSGAIYKLFPIQNGLLVFAANGIWFITGSQGIGFSATDYTITKISGIQSISSTSYINVMGYPLFWNEEGVYGVAPSQTGSLTVNNLCLGTILSFYQDIPLQSKKFVKGDYNPITFVVKWVYRSTNESSVTDRYQYDSVLNFNVIHKSFYVYNISQDTSGAGSPWVHDVKYVQSPGGSGSPSPTFKYISSYPTFSSYLFTFSEENNSNYLDWQSYDGLGVNFKSTFTTGYKVHGQAFRKFQALWTYVYMRRPSTYTINAIWDYANNPNSGKYSVRQQSTNLILPTRDYLYRRHRLRGRGISLQLQFTSIDGQPFDLIGWAIFEEINQVP